MTNTPAPCRALAEQDTPVPYEDKASVTLSKRPASSFSKERTYSLHKKAATAAPDEKEAARASVTTLNVLMPLTWPSSTASSLNFNN
ncbi:hypothetical protein K504DRAFT_508902 [Pleomassaria siparia CBS 279.74]|uniref:Uncharacterized protein n=1 Tax=Pleomassaria siparia CBS 279.74 TaxID=1314801 RepID=A0A6G1JQ02_9PLEO|nr:hypothetical protein K504DRAFT_508902 [Pleomassaria siparia CBS 279.74]